MMKEERKFFQIFYSLYIYILICAIATTSYFYSNGEIMYDENVFTISKALIIKRALFSFLLGLWGLFNAKFFLVVRLMT